MSQPKITFGNTGSGHNLGSNQNANFGQGRGSNPIVNAVQNVRINRSAERMGTAGQHSSPGRNATQGGLLGNAAQNMVTTGQRQNPITHTSQGAVLNNATQNMATAGHSSNLIQGASKGFVMQSATQNLAHQGVSAGRTGTNISFNNTGLNTTSFGQVPRTNFVTSENFTRTLSSERRHVEPIRHEHRHEEVRHVSGEHRLAEVSPHHVVSDPVRISQPQQHVVSVAERPIPVQHSIVRETFVQPVEIRRQSYYDNHVMAGGFATTGHQHVESYAQQRPAYQKLYSHSNQNDRKVASDIEPTEKKGCCSPCCWILAILLGLAILTLGLLFGLGVLKGWWGDNNFDPNAENGGGRDQNDQFVVVEQTTVLDGSAGNSTSFQKPDGGLAGNTSFQRPQTNNSNNKPNNTKLPDNTTTAGTQEGLDWLGSTAFQFPQNLKREDQEQSQLQKGENNGAAPGQQQLDENPKTAFMYAPANANSNSNLQPDNLQSGRVPANSSLIVGPRPTITPTSVDPTVSRPIPVNGDQISQREPNDDVLGGIVDDFEDDSEHPTTTPATSQPRPTVNNVGPSVRPSPIATPIVNPAVARPSGTTTPVSTAEEEDDFARLMEQLFGETLSEANTHKAELLAQAAKV